MDFDLYQSDIDLLSQKLIKTKLLASPDSSGILLLASLARKRYSGWQEHLVLNQKIFAPKKKYRPKKSTSFATDAFVLI
ncbi:hypothetical protein [Flavobacterium sp.]|uniref:hypothetical protein n=1 Tax=Flavobacterium sp. TaxID=239 RepID=UPI003263BBA4